MSPPAASAQRSTLGSPPVLALYMDNTKGSKGPGYTIHVENLTYSKLNVTLNFSKSTNLTVAGAKWGAGMAVTSRIDPGKGPTPFAALDPKAPKKKFGVSYQASWIEAAPDPREVANERSQRGATVVKRIANQKALEKTLKSPDPDSLRAALTQPNVVQRFYVDTSFPPLGRSVGMPNAEARTCWRRPEEFEGHAAKFHVFADDGIDASDIAQGELGNCWFMCSLAALTEFPECIDALFTTQWQRPRVAGNASSANAPVADTQGMYGLRFCIHGEWLSVTIDDHFPCKPDERAGPIFSQSHGPELWVLLVEKAYAKLQGSYYACRLGSPHEALVDLTGAPVIKRNFKDGDTSFSDFLTWDRNDCLMSASTPGVDQQTECGSRGGSGLVPGHAYTVIRAHVVQMGRYKGSEILQVRNPWGSFEWSGKVSHARREQCAGISLSPDH